jgi:hypothetical protein
MSPNNLVPTGVGIIPAHIANFESGSNVCSKTFFDQEQADRTMKNIADVG